MKRLGHMCGVGAHSIGQLTQPPMRIQDATQSSTHEPIDCMLLPPIPPPIATAGGGNTGPSIGVARLWPWGSVRSRCTSGCIYAHAHVHTCPNPLTETHQQLSAWLVDGKRVSLDGTGRSVTSRVDMALPLRWFLSVGGGGISRSVPRVSPRRCGRWSIIIPTPPTAGGAYHHPQIDRIACVGSIPRGRQPSTALWLLWVAAIDS